MTRHPFRFGLLSAHARRTRPSVSAPVMNHDHPFFRHFPDRKVGPLTGIARGLRPPVRHLVDAEGWRLVHGHTAELEAPNSAERLPEIPRIDASLQPELRAVRQFDSLINVVEDAETHDGTKDL